MDNEAEIIDNKKASRSPLSRMLAIIGLIIILCFVVYMLYCIVTGSPRLLASVVSTVIVSVVIYLILWVSRAYSKNS